MNIDPLAEKYSYQSPYNFSENRVIDCRELEGLEAVKYYGTGKDKTIYETVRINPNNNTNQWKMSEEDVKVAFMNFEMQAEKSWSGNNTKGQYVCVDIVMDENATLNLNYVDTIFNPSSESGSYQQLNEFQSVAGFTDDKDHGNTQTGTMQISSRNTIPQADDPKNGYEVPARGSTASHELGHIFGNEHNKTKQLGNLMNDGAKNNERNVTPEQRDEMLKNTPEIK